MLLNQRHYQTVIPVKENATDEQQAMRMKMGRDKMEIIEDFKVKLRELELQQQESVYMKVDPEDK